MNEKPEALRLADDLETFHSAKKEMPSVGGQMLGLESYRVVATGEVFSRVLDAAAELRRQHEEIERLREEARNWRKSFAGHVYVKNEDYAELVGKRDALKAENERLREALVRHGKHTADCCDMYRGCVCGLDAALRREEP